MLFGSTVIQQPEHQRTKIYNIQKSAAKQKKTFSVQLKNKFPSRLRHISH